MAYTTRKFNTIEESFNDKFKLIDTEDCIVWQHAKTKRGYGMFTFRNKQYYAHIFSYKMYNGDIEGRLEVCHTCDNPSCCNPKHLFLGTHKENMGDCSKKGRASGGSFPGEKHFNAKLTELKVKEIKKLVGNGIRTVTIAKLYNVSRPTIQDIISGRTWTHIK